MRISISQTSLLILLNFVGVALADTGELTEAAYLAEFSSKGVVLLDVDLGR